MRRYSTELWQGLHSSAGWHNVGGMSDAPQPFSTLPSAEQARLIRLAAQALGRALGKRGWRVATAESCTGGGIAAAITEVAGSSGWFEYGLVTYANRAKQQLLGVSEATLASEGAVSEAVVTQMVRGALMLSGADLAVAVSGVAGPGGGSPDKPVGTVWLAWGQRGNEDVAVRARCCHFPGDREAVRAQTVWLALRELEGLAGAETSGPGETTV